MVEKNKKKEEADYSKDKALYLNSDSIGGSVQLPRDKEQQKQFLIDLRLSYY